MAYYMVNNKRNNFKLLEGKKIMSGYHFLFVPGPSNVPAAVQQAIHCPMEDHRNPTIQSQKILKKFF